MTVKSNRINTSVSFAFANIAENSLEVKQGDLLSFTADWFVTKATPETVIIWIANDKFSFPETNETQEQWRVNYNPVIWENTYKMEVKEVDMRGPNHDYTWSLLKVGYFYTMDENQKLDPTTASPSVWQFMIQDIYENCVDVRFVTNLWLAIDQYEDVRLESIAPKNPESTPFDWIYNFTLSNWTVIEWDFSDLCRWTTDIEFGGNVTVAWNLQVVWETTLWDTTTNDLTANDIQANSVTADVTAENANIWTANIEDLNVDNMSYTNPVNFQHSIDVDEDLNVDGSAHIGWSATVDHDLTVWEQLILGPNATAPQFVMEATRNQANWFAGLNANGQLDNSVLPPLAIWETYVEDTEAKMLALQAQTGDVCVRTDEVKTYIKLNDNNPATMADWQVLLFPGQNAWGQITWDINDQLDLINKLSEYAEINNLKTINGESIVWTGNINVDWIVKSATAPENPEQGDVYYNTTDDTIYSYNWEERVAVGSGSFDPTAYYPTLHAWLADNLYTNDNIIDVDTWNFRTTAGSQSVPSSGIASLNYIRWKSERTTPKTECVINFNTSDWIYITNINKYQTLYATNNTTGTTTFTLTSWVWDTDPSTYGLTVQLQQQEFTITNASWSDSWETFQSYVNTARWTFRLWYEDWAWTLSNWTDTWNNVDPASDLWMMDAHITDVIYVNYYDECTDWTLELIFTAEIRWEITNSTPGYLEATGVNQYDGQTVLSNVEIQNGEIVSGSNYIVRVPAYGWVVNWYMWYCPDGYIVNCGRVDDLNATLQVWTAVDTDWAVVTSTSCYMPNEETWYFLVEVSQNVDDTELSVHPKRSGQQDTNTDVYETSRVIIPTEDVNSTSLPTDSYGMPSVWETYDAISWQTQTYVKRIEVLPFTYSDLLSVVEMWVEFDYDTDYIYYVLWNPVTYQLEFDNTYTANDYGTERILTFGDDLNPLAVQISISYGSNLVDKLRTWVVTKEEYPQVISQAQYDALPATKTTDWIIRFIFTEEA